MKITNVFLPMALVAMSSRASSMHGQIVDSGQMFLIDGTRLTEPNVQMRSGTAVGRR